MLRLQGPENLDRCIAQISKGICADQRSPTPDHDMLWTGLDRPARMLSKESHPLILEELTEHFVGVSTQTIPDAPIDSPDPAWQAKESQLNTGWP